MHNKFVYMSNNLQRRRAQVDKDGSGWTTLDFQGPLIRNIISQIDSTKMHIPSLF